MLERMDKKEQVTERIWIIMDVRNRLRNSPLERISFQLFKVQSIMYCVKYHFIKYAGTHCQYGVFNLKSMTLILQYSDYLPNRRLKRGRRGNLRGSPM